MGKEHSGFSVLIRGKQLVENHRASIFLSSNALSGIAAASGRLGEAMIFAGVAGVSGGVVIIKDVVPGVEKLISKVTPSKKNK